ncbi:hypothetical protein [Pseudoxanthomonas mexicana]|uniref:hypothetical protein n=1 Tax=Pseudoxanthomonas mexicana TaxID=128785 RepID=UPI00398AEC73
MLRLLPLMLLLGACATAMAQNGRVNAPSDVTSCQELAEKPAETGLADTPRDRAAAVRNKYAPVSTALPAPASGSRGGGDDDESPLPRPRAPKWHSFLPGMFR